MLRRPGDTGDDDEQRQADGDRSKQHPGLGQTHAQPTVVEHRQPPEGDDETGRANRPAEAPAARHEGRDEDGEEERVRQYTELSVAQPEACQPSDSEAVAAGGPGGRARRNRRRHTGDEIPTVAAEQ